MTDSRTTEERSHDQPGMIPFVDPEKAISREVEIVAERFPDTDFAMVDATVREILEQLRADAEVEMHVLSLTRNQAIERLREQGHAFRPPTKAESEVEAGYEVGKGDRPARPGGPAG
jgi:hypothetical protein